MNFQTRLMVRDSSFEVFSFCVYSIKKVRLIPSVYRYPFLSIQWLFFTVAVSCFTKINAQQTVERTGENMVNQ